MCQSRSQDGRDDDTTSDDDDDGRQVERNYFWGTSEGTMIVDVAADVFIDIAAVTLDDNTGQRLNDVVSGTMTTLSE